MVNSDQTFLHSFTIDSLNVGGCSGLVLLSLFFFCKLITMAPSKTQRLPSLGNTSQTRTLKHILYEHFLESIYFTAKLPKRSLHVYFSIEQVTQQKLLYNKVSSVLAFREQQSSCTGHTHLLQKDGDCHKQASLLSR